MSSSTSVVTINAVTLPVLNYRDQRVVTTDHLAQLYGTDPARIRKNFERNADRFEQGRHFFKIDGEELSVFKTLTSAIDKFAPHALLWTERGAARHAKMLETDQAWEVFEKLEAAYFDGITPHHPQSSNAILAQQLADLLKDKVLVDYQDLVDLANTAYAMRAMTAYVGDVATRIEQKIGKPLLNRVGDAPASTPASTSRQVATAQPMNFDLDRIEQIVKSAGADGITRSQLHNNTRFFSKLDRDVIVRELVRQGRIIEKREPAAGEGDRKVTRLVHAAFAGE